MGAPEKRTPGAAATAPKGVNKIFRPQKDTPDSLEIQSWSTSTTPDPLTYPIICRHFGVDIVGVGKVAA